MHWHIEHITPNGRVTEVIVNQERPPYEDLATTRALARECEIHLAARLGDTPRYHDRWFGLRPCAQCELTPGGALYSLRGQP